jgi:hypothetical protein
MGIAICDQAENTPIVVSQSARLFDALCSLHRHFLRTSTGEPVDLQPQKTTALLLVITAALRRHVGTREPTEKVPEEMVQRALFFGSY